MVLDSSVRKGCIKYPWLFNRSEILIMLAKKRKKRGLKVNANTSKVKVLGGRVMKD